MNENKEYNSCGCGGNCSCGKYSEENYLNELGDD